jgi:glutaredoxin 3
VEIKLYITQTNPWCKQLKTWLKRRRLPLEIMDLDESATARDELIEKSNQMAIPMVEINGEIIIGCQMEKIEAAINKAKELDASNNDTTN